MENNKVLILGGAGFIGSQLASFLIKKKKVSIIDGLVVHTGGSLENIQNFQSNLLDLKLSK